MESKISLKDRLAELRELCDRATEGPWYIEENEVRHDFDPYATEEIGADCTTRIAECWDFQQNELKFIAESRTAMPQLIEALQAAISQRDHVIEWYCDTAKGARVGIKTYNEQIEQILKGGKSDG